MEIQKPYALFCPDHRTNFLNYYYTIYKLCEILDYKEFLEYFPMLKDRSKIIEQDEIWRKICKELKWGLYSNYYLKLYCRIQKSRIFFNICFNFINFMKIWKRFFFHLIYYHNIKNFLDRFDGCKLDTV